MTESCQIFALPSNNNIKRNELIPYLLTEEKTSMTFLRKDISMGENRKA